MLKILVDIYTAVHHMSCILEIDFCFPKHGSRQKASNLPEISLVALLIIAVKVYYPFDSLERHQRSHLDAGVLTIDWDKWFELLEQHDKSLISKDSIGRGNALLVTEQDVMKMSVNQLDEYLDWYEKTWISEEDEKQKKKGLPKQLLDMFPTGRQDGSLPTAVDFDAETKAEQYCLDEKLQSVQSRLKTRRLIPGEHEGKGGEALRRPGSFYKRYRKIEDFPPHAKKFHEAAASLVGISFSTLAVAVRQMERKLQCWRDKRLKENLEESEDDELDSD
jgi:RNA polymerase I-specific transcription initiation factor RRN7